MPGGNVLPTNLLSTFDLGFFPNATGIHHEDFSDVLTIIDSTQTPLFSGSPKTRSRDVVHSWPVDSLIGATAINAQATAGVAEGIDFAGDTLTKPVRLLNYTQLFRRDVIVSDRERQANPAGVRDMYNHQIMKEFKNLARMAEYRLFQGAHVSGQPLTASGAEATTAPLMAGIGGFGITTAATSVASNAIAFGDIHNLSMNMFNNGAEPDSIWFSPPLKLNFYTLTSGNVVNTKNIAAVDQRLIANVEVYESPMGQLFAVITDRFIPLTSASATSATGAFYIGDRSMAKVAFYTAPTHTEMGKSGLHTRGIVSMEMTLELAHPSTWGAVVGYGGTAGFITA